MGYTVQLTKRAAKGALLLPRTYKELLKQLIEELKKDPLPKNFDIKKLKGYRSTYRVRLGSYRVIYVVDEKNKVITLTYVGPRGEAY
ncbi:toxin RelE [Ignicoccus pacificus DSM 13166]|uniref:Toxin RelE n=1 Tax=Ignicoccus pacificus DSM 13166 TaxID=940294 RepID=A0A977KAV5_9CREN|nr:toxin RelE [Ignicoccus pacificus DSM 13166]